MYILIGNLIDTHYIFIELPRRFRNRLAKTCRDSRRLDTGNWRRDSSAVRTSRTLDDQRDRERPWPVDYLTLINTLITAHGL